MYNQQVCTTTALLLTTRKTVQLKFKLKNHTQEITPDKAHWQHPAKLFRRHTKAGSRTKALIWHMPKEEKLIGIFE